MSPGLSLAHYRITAKLGEGGMGEVWRATDTKLGREVAIKILPEALAADPDRMARFEREAKVLASLNHPNIAAIHGVEERALVMELAEGPTLEERIAQGAIPASEALPIVQQLIDALEYAHEKGVVHRDLKPANIKLTPEGRVKVLDFGLAKALSNEPSRSDLATSPTLTMRATIAGVILGTAAYMSPEQARGQQVDKRSDIWSFGVVVHEMLTGRTLFQAPTVSDTLAAVLRADLDWSALPRDLQPNIGAVVRRCLERDPKRRLRDIGDARILLDERESAASAPSPQAAAAPSSGARVWIAAAAISTLALIALAAIHFRETAPPREQIRLAVTLPEGGSISAFPGLAVSPDGRKLVFGVVTGGRSTLWVRTLDSLEARPLPGTENGNFPFWSSDGRSLGFTADGKLKKIDWYGGPPQILCPVISSNAPTTGAWTPEGVIYFANGGEGIFRVPQAGGEPARVTRIDGSAGELMHAYPYALPDGRHILLLISTGSPEQTGIYRVSLDGKEKKLLARSPRRSFGYAPPLEGQTLGHLLVMRQDTLMALPVNPKTIEPAGDPFPLASRVGNTLSQAFFAVSPSGVLAYRVGGGRLRRLTWFDRSGKTLSTVGASGDYIDVALSRDGTRAAVSQYDSEGTNLDIWTIDLARGVPSRFTFHQADDANPVWSPDGTKIAFSSQRDGPAAIYLKDSSGAQEQRLQKAGENGRATGWSPDGRFLMYTNGEGAPGLWTLADPLDPAKRTAAPYLDGQGQYGVMQGQFAPGAAGAPRWVAYTSSETKRSPEVFVQSFPAGAGPYQISTGGGIQPRWRPDGKELFYMTPGGKIMAVDVKTSPRFEAGIPHALFDTHEVNPPASFAFRYDVSPDGQRFLANLPVQGGAEVTQPITVVLNWLAGAKK